MDESSASASSRHHKKSNAAAMARSRSRRAAVLHDLVEGQDSMLEMARKFSTRIERIREVRAMLESAKEDIEWFKSQEAQILDLLRSQMLFQFLSDPDRKFSLVDLGIALDKSRLIRGASTANLAGILQIIHGAEAVEMQRLRGLAQGSPPSEDDPATGQGGTPGAGGR